mgnify:CR=1 FL=1
MRSGIKTVIAVCYGFIGVLVVIAGVCLWISLQRFKATALRTEGTVIRFTKIESHQGEKTNTQLQYLVQYRVEDKQYTVSVSSFYPAYSIGQKVMVLYSPDDPEQSKIDSFQEISLGPLFSIGVGSIFIIFALFYRR